MNNSSVTSATNGQRPLNYEAVPQVVPIAVVILLTNGIVFVLFWKRKSLRTPSNYLLFSLAISDIMTGLINIPLFLSDFILNDGLFKPALLGTSQVFHNVISFSIAYHITAVTAEKYLAVVNPFGRNMRTKKTAFKVASVIWLWSILLGTAPACWFNERLAKENLAYYMQAGYNIFCLVIVFLLPFMFILYAYCIMFRAVSSKSSLRKSLQQQKGTRAFKKASNEKKCLIILLAMAVTFAMCWLPWFMLMLLFSLVPIGWIQIRYVIPLTPATQIFLIIRYLSSAINPLLYTFFKQDFWSAFRIIVLKKRPSTRPPSARLVSERTRGSDQINKNLLEENVKTSSSV